MFKSPKTCRAPRRLKKKKKKKKKEEEEKKRKEKRDNVIAKWQEHRFHLLMDP